MISIQDLLARLAKVRRERDNQWQACCPAHDDSNPSLSIGIGADGRILLDCKAGCTFNSVTYALGVKPADLMPDSNAPAPQPKPQLGPIVKTYDYIDAQGELLYQVTRHEPKDFRQRRPDGRGGWIWNLEQTTRVLYRLRDIIDADPADFVVIVEGEKDADALAEIGITATTCPQGAGKWHKTDDSILANRRIVIIPDDDDAGRSHAKQVAKSLESKAQEIRALALPDAKDAADWVEQGGTAAKLRNLIAERTPFYVKRTLGIQALIADEITPRAIEWLWKPRIPIGKLTMIAGDPKTGKSLLTADLAAHVSSGQRWPDYADGAQPPAPARVLMLSAEDDPEDTIVPRLMAAGADLSRVHIITGCLDPQDETGSERFFALESDVRQLERYAAKHSDTALIIIDPISAYFATSDTHKNAEVRRVLAPLAAMAQTQRLAVVAISHRPKRSSDKAVYSVMGSLGFTAAARAVWLVSRDPEDRERRLMLNAGTNLAPDAGGLAYWIRPAPHNADIPILEWDPQPLDMDADDHLATETERKRPDTKLDHATKWLENYLLAGPKPARDIIKAAAEGELISKPTLDRAKRKLGAYSYATRKENGTADRHFWALPDWAETSDNGDLSEN